VKEADMLSRKNLALAAAGGAALVLAACGGGDDGNGILTPPVVTPPVATTAVPDSAVASSMALVSYINGLKVDDETSESLTLPTLDVAASETEEPIAL
jgi:hypothetical protein